jgi:hypothetical protein
MQWTALAHLATLALLPLATYAAPGTVLPSTEIELIPVATGLQQPHRVMLGQFEELIVERDGKLRLVGTTGNPTVLDLGPSGTPPSPGFSAGANKGLFAVVPDVHDASNERYLVAYTDANSDLVVARYRKAAGPDLQLVEEAIVLRVDHDFGDRAVGDMAYTFNGLLLIGVADGGGSGDPCFRAQTLRIADLDARDDDHPACPPDAPFVANGGDPDSRALQGKLLLIDPSGTSVASPDDELCGAGDSGTVLYRAALPGINPHAADDGICDEVLHWGFRHPVRIDGTTSALTDWGDADVDEINSGVDRIDANLNFGWPCASGMLELADARCEGVVDTFDIEYPDFVVDLAQGEGRLSNLVRLDAPRIGLGGVYFYSQTVSGRIQAYRNYAATSPFVAGYRLEQLWRIQPGIVSIDSITEGSPYFVDQSAGTLYTLRTRAMFRDGMESEF